MRTLLVTLLVCLLATACSSRHIGIRLPDGTSCGYDQLDPDAESIQAVTSSLGDLAGSALRSAAGVPPVGFQAPKPQPQGLPPECVEAETCVHYEQTADGQRCTVIRGGMRP